MWGSATGRKSPGASGIEGQWGLCAGAPQDWGKQIPHSRKAHTGFHVHWVPGQSKVFIGIWVKPDCSSWRTSWEKWGKHGFLWGRTLEEKLLGIFNSMPFSGGGHFEKIWPHPSVSAEKPQGKQQSRWDHSPAPQSTGYLKTPQAHSCLYSHPETKPHPPEGLESAPPTSGQASPPHQETYSKPPP